MLDLSFGLPLVVRDAALKMVAPGPTSDVNREYFAQNNERAIEEGRAGVEEYEKTDEKARELLRRLATSKPYFRKGPSVDESGAVASSHGNAAVGAGRGGPGPIRTRDSRAAGAVAGRATKSKQGPNNFAHTPITAKDWTPPDDKSIMSLFVTGVEDDLPEFKIRDFFKAYGKIKSLVCSHMSHCAFVNYETREGAEQAALACQGKAVIAGCPLRVRWKMPAAVGNMNREQRSQVLMDARRAVVGPKAKGPQRIAAAGASESESQPEAHEPPTIAAPPGAEDVPKYASLDGA